MDSTLFINYAKKGKKRAGLLPCELCLLLRKERSPRLCDVGGKVSHCIDCPVVDLQVFPCRVQRVDCQLVVDANRPDCVVCHFVRLSCEQVAVWHCRDVQAARKLLLCCKRSLDHVLACLDVVQLQVRD